MQSNVVPLATSGVVRVVVRSDLSWSQEDLPAHFDIRPMYVLSQLDPEGADGLVLQVLRLFQTSLVVAADSVARARSLGTIADIRFVSHRLKASATQLGCVRLSDACVNILKRVATGMPAQAESLTGEFGALVTQLTTEIEQTREYLDRLLPPCCSTPSTG